MDPIVIVAAAAALSAIAFGIADFKRRQSRNLHVVAERRLGSTSAAAAGATATPSGEAVTLLKRRLPFTGAAGYERTARMLDRAGLRLTPREFLALRLASGFVGFMIAALLFGWQPLGWLAGSLLAVVAYMLPRLIVSWRTKKRVERLEFQLIDMLSLLANSVRSGFALLQGLDMVSQRAESPLADDLIRLLSEVRLGRPIEDALRDWAARVGSPDVQLVVTAILVQRTSGGNLAEVLENLAQTMRERVELRDEIRSLTAHPRLTAKAVSAYPLVIAVLLTIINTRIWLRLWTEPSGWAFLGVAFALNVLAYFVLRRVTQVEY